jgi:hypothetical protein
MATVAAVGVAFWIVYEVACSDNSQLFLVFAEQVWDWVF